MARDDAVRVERDVGGKVVHLDVLHVDGAAYLTPLEHIAHEAEQVGEVGDELRVGLEVNNVDRVEAHKRVEEPDVEPRRLRRVAEEAPGRQSLLEEGQRFEELLKVQIVRLLLRREATLVHGIVHAFVDDGRVERLQLRRRVAAREEVELRILGQVLH